MDFDSIVRVIQEIGFPIFAAVFLMCRVERKLDELHRDMEELKKMK